ncbi:MAG TPA: FGGY family carbohydrate kinase [Acidimicrobiales bacterium]|nr:FGGY family carbohydrate kinase [Acidimicrobiales bacterium]
MTAAVLVGVDIGSQSVKTAFFVSTGGCLAESSRPVTVDRRSAEEVQQRPDDFYDAAVATIADCVESSGCRPGDVAGIAVAGQMAGVLGVGADGAPVTPYDSWLDSRCLPQLARIDRQMGDLMTEVTGCPPMVAHAPKMLWWQDEQPDVHRRVAKWVVPSAFVTGRLAGLTAGELYIDRTHLHFSGLAEAVNGRWSAELIARAGVPADRLPPVVEPAAVAGMLSSAAATACGLRAGTPVAAGLGDTAAGALGAGAVWPGQLLDTAGTASVLAISTPAFRPDPSRTLVVMRGAVAGQWFSLSYLPGGDLLNWACRALGLGSVGDLAKEAGSASAGRVVFVPHLGGRILPAAPDARGAWLGLDMAHGRGDLARSVFEAVAYEYAGYLDRVLDLAPDLVPAEVRVIGGGGANDMWNRIKASVLGLPYRPLLPRNFTCWGAALVAGAAVGAVEDMVKTAGDAAQPCAEVLPEAGLQAVYQRRLQDYRAAVGALLPGAEVRV